TSASSGPLDRLLHEVLARPALPSPRLAADVYETADGNAFVVEIPVPGLTPDQLTIEATADTLTVATQPRPAEREPGRTYIQREQAPGPMSRVIEFPVDIDTDNIRATLELGLLKIHVPKAMAGRRRIIKISSGQGPRKLGMDRQGLDHIRAGLDVYQPDGTYVGTVVGLHPDPPEGSLAPGVGYVEIEVKRPDRTRRLHLPLTEVLEVHSDRMIAEVDPDF